MSATTIIAVISCLLTGCAESKAPTPPSEAAEARISPISCALELRPAGGSQAFVARVSSNGPEGLVGKASLTVRSPGIEVDDRRRISVTAHGEEEVQFSPLPLTNARLQASLTIEGSNGEIRCETGL
ncbi:hypothetical protein [Pseudogemmobacter bohemicus]|uniref:hypothetical protein n=1 Tax=Pseudogemmobacter bohemicus TaxID=2250708 RepID=UPI000DD4B5D4|nr:hypothetical protein [Pseudogemmobacter bohemicus]